MWKNASNLFWLLLRQYLYRRSDQKPIVSGDPVSLFFHEKLVSWFELVENPGTTLFICTM
jgi:hypothetical protein